MQVNIWADVVVQNTTKIIPIFTREVKTFWEVEYIGCLMIETNFLDF